MNASFPFEAAETPRGSNAPEFTVSELARSVKNTVEDRFGQVRVRGENNGHYVIAIPPLWEATVDAYLNEIGAPPRR